MSASWVHPGLHPVFEALGYVAGYLLYRRARARRGDALNDERRWMVIAAAAVGALVGSRLLGLAEMAPVRGMSWHDFLLPGGKTIVGGLLGGWFAVELAKRAMGLRLRTGDLFAVPLCVGIAVGRIGCFFAGLADDTYGKATTLPWGVDFGDGLRRHPTQIYEIVFLMVLAWVLMRLEKNPTPPMRARTRTHEWGTPSASERARREEAVFRLLPGGVSGVATGDRLPEAAAAGGWIERDSMGVRGGAGDAGCCGDGQQRRRIESCKRTAIS